MNTLHKRLLNRNQRTVRVYDAGPDSGDRFTVVFSQRQSVRGRTWWNFLGMNSTPFSPNLGVCQHGELRTGDYPIPKVGRKGYLGKRILFSDLPKDCQKAVVNSLAPIR